MTEQIYKYIDYFRIRPNKVDPSTKAIYMTARYLELLDNGELKGRVRRAYKTLENCKLCPRECGVNRLRDEKGVCKTGLHAYVASHNSHFGEEPPISGNKGSGTIFFSSCNLRCIFCQNYPISQLGHGKKVSPYSLAMMMLSLQRDGCHNINLVTPSHVVPQFIAALYIAAKRGLSIPVVYNTSGYDGLESLKLLDGIVDVYLPDIKYADNENAKKITTAENYWESATKAVKEMYRQVGDLKTDKHGIATRGLIIRHLALPKNLSGTDIVLKFIADEISKETFVSLMSQYFPADRALQDPILKRKITREEFREAKEWFYEAGLSNGWVQEI